MIQYQRMKIQTNYDYPLLLHLQRYYCLYSIIRPRFNPVYVKGISDARTTQKKITPAGLFDEKKHANNVCIKVRCEYRRRVPI